MAIRSSSDIQKDITIITNKISTIQSAHDNNVQSLLQWMSLCGNTNSCDAYGKNAIANLNAAIKSDQIQLDNLNAQLNGYKNELATALSNESNSNLTPDQKATADAAAAKQKNYRTALIAGIVIVVIVVGIWAYKKFKNKG